MSMLAFMPWCRIEKVYDIGETQILPFERHRPIEGLDDAAQCLVNLILANYKTIEGKPIDRAAFVRYGGKALIDDLNEEEREAIRELVALACFCGLAKREYFSLGPYCNSDCFVLYIQEFDRADYIALTTRRREGQHWSGWSIDDIAITIPMHCHTVREVSLDEALLSALTAYSAQVNDNEWGRWQSAISCFNQANMDSDNIRYQVEWVLLCGAFERLLEAKSEARDVATKFSEAMAPSESLLVGDARRRAARWTDDGRPLRYEWMSEFYRIRGGFAHGKLSMQQHTVWNLLEHLVLATIAFPLLVKCLLKKACVYELTDDDLGQIESFEALANTEDFLSPPSDPKSSIDSHWARLRCDRILKLTLKKVWEKCKAEGLLSEELEEDTSSGDDSSGKDA